MDDFKPGDTVRIRTGAFAAFTGKVSEVREGGHALKIAVMIFGRADSIELPPEGVEKITFTDDPGNYSSDK